MLEHKITTLIIANNNKELNKVSELFEFFEEVSLVGGTTTAKQAFSLIDTYVPQLIFINAEFEEYSGLDLVRKLYSKSIFPEIVFYASDDTHAYESLALGPLDFLIQPIEKDEIVQMLDRLRFKLKRNELKRKMDIYSRSQDVKIKRVFPLKRGVIVLYLNEIVCCKSTRTKTILTLTNNEEIEVRSNLSESLDILNNQLFFKISRSYCINRNYLRKIDKKNAKCLMHYEGNSWEIPASRNIIRRLDSLYTRPLY